LAENKGLCTVCLACIREAKNDFHTRFPDFVLSALAEASDERPSLYLGSSKLRQQCMNFMAVHGFRSKMKYLRELAFPSEAYMHAKYPVAKLRWLPWLYARRGLGGVAKIFGVGGQAP
jgi:hypothetical protein